MPGCSVRSVKPTQVNHPWKYKEAEEEEEVEVRSLITVRHVDVKEVNLSVHRCDLPVWSEQQVRVEHLRCCWGSLVFVCLFVW